MVWTAGGETGMTELPTTSTTLGTLRGCVEDGLCVLRGVPYAAPPVGLARWKAARPHPGWDGVRDATEYGPSAPQPWRPGGMPPIGSHGEPPFGEDCLTQRVDAGHRRRPPPGAGLDSRWRSPDRFGEPAVPCSSTASLATAMSWRSRSATGWVLWASCLVLAMRTSGSPTRWRPCGGSPPMRRRSAGSGAHHPRWPVRWCLLDRGSRPAPRHTGAFPARDSAEPAAGFRSSRCRGRG